MQNDLKHYLDFHGKRINRALMKFLPKATEKPRVIHEAMRYSIAAGGKRLRPILVIAGAETCRGKAVDVLPTACAMELIHTYSLIHDDLPSMDDDDLRRGKPTNHKVFGENVAILAGDALLTHAFHLMAQNASKNRVDSRAVIKVIKIVSEAAGTSGMVGGQAADIEADKGRWKKMGKAEFTSPKNLLEFIHLNKTAALIRASLVAGGTLAQGTSREIRALDNYGKCIGLAFQITDDILDQVGDKQKLGKRGSDKANQKLTYPALYGIDRSRKVAAALIAQAQKSLKPFEKSAQILHALASYILSRDH